MNNYEITFTQNYPDRNRMYVDELLYIKMTKARMEYTLPDEFKKLNIEIEEVEEI